MGSYAPVPRSLTWLAESTVEFHVQSLDGLEHEGKYPSYDDLEKRHFVSQALGDMATWCVPAMADIKNGGMLENQPKVAAFKATFIHGGLVFIMHNHHYSNDAMGWAGELHQLAENSAAIWNAAETESPAFPPWDPACLDLSRLTAPDLPEDQLVDMPVPVQAEEESERRPYRTSNFCCLFRCLHS